MGPTAIVQARIGSTRLPRKVLSKVGGIPMLLFQIKRIKKSHLVDDVVVATSDNQIDDEIQSLCDQHKIKYFRGSEFDVLKRFYETAEEFSLDTIIRLNADCPFIDPEIIDKTIQGYYDEIGQFDYASTILKPTFPLGMHVEIFSKDALKIAHNDSTLPEDREHVTPYIYNNKNIFKLLSIESEVNHSSYRFTVDYQEDLVFVNKVYDLIDDSKKVTFNTMDLVNVLDANKNIILINNKFIKNQNIIR